MGLPHALFVFFLMLLILRGGDSSLIMQGSVLGNQVSIAHFHTNFHENGNFPSLHLSSFLVYLLSSTQCPPFFGPSPTECERACNYASHAACGSWFSEMPGLPSGSVCNCSLSDFLCEEEVDVSRKFNLLSSTSQYLELLPNVTLAFKQTHLLASFRFFNVQPKAYVVKLNCKSPGPLLRVCIYYFCNNDQMWILSSLSTKTRSPRQYWKQVQTLCGWRV